MPASPHVLTPPVVHWTVTPDGTVTSWQPLCGAAAPNDRYSVPGWSRRTVVTCPACNEWLHA